MPRITDRIFAENCHGKAEGIERSTGRSNTGTDIQCHYDDTLIRLDPFSYFGDDFYYFVGHIGQYGNQHRTNPKQSPSS